MSKFISSRILWLSTLMTLLVFNIEKTISGVKNALNLCACAIIPSLLIFMVFSEVLVAVLSEEKNIKIPPKFLIYMLGSFCGFPIGASVCKTFCDNKIISRRDAALIIPYCNNASFGFVVGAIGISFFENQKLGYILFVSQLIASSIPIFFIKLNYNYTKNNKGQSSIFEIFFKAIEKSIKNILNVCGLICIFSAILEILKNFSLDFVSVFLELSNAIAYCSSFREVYPCLSFVLCGFCCGFSGICVLLQIKSTFKDKELNFARLFLCKTIQGIFTALLSLIGYNFFVCT